MDLFAALPERGTSVLVASHDLALVKRMRSACWCWNRGGWWTATSRRRTWSMRERTAGTHAGRFRTWLAHHGFSVMASLGRLLGRPWSACSRSR